MDQLRPLPTLADFENDGRRVLVQLIGLSAWRSLDQALASLTVFAHPDAVGSVGTRAVFRTIRGGPKGAIIGDAMLDDNASPATAFEWATGFKRGPDLQCNHLYAAARDPASYSDLRNICYTPTFIAKLTDSKREDVPEGHLSHLLRFRAFELYGYAGPQGAPPPRKPSGYDDLVWPDPIGGGATAEVAAFTFRRNMARRPKDRLAKAARLVGWTFSDYRPDETVVYLGS
ncbi:hypothetical protein PMNALOAF_3547 [Methylobacterium adhaesivum]|uniref:Uncharacterized protein n=1 Tax=Methylobacterium adhaesivum TaxID=333297 RepID=A0ABT8BMH6_9HYPH|nr:hypothetical protein [Methylobacterium adhaesivum]MDN3592406.1 hypothetical protein [Methylobacterium adhaesivum]GJD32279.1 hypothetical protein PMNALOAF_3547 [Methylobacterium adhaesivum]